MDNNELNQELYETILETTKLIRNTDPKEPYYKVLVDSLSETRQMYDRIVRDEREEERKIEEIENREKELKERRKDRWFNFGKDFGIMAIKTFVNILVFNKSMRFEETGSFTTQSNRDIRQSMISRN